MANQERLDAIYKAGLNRNYDFNNRDYYQDKEEVKAFEDGLRQSMKNNPMEQTTFKVVITKQLTFNELQKLRGEYKLGECKDCNTVVNMHGGDNHCPDCHQQTIVPITDERIDDRIPWSHCIKCDYDFMWDDALGGAGEPGSYLCPKCGRLTV